MKVDVHVPGSLGGEAEQAAQLEADGFDTLWVAETNHDPFLRSLLISGATSHARSGTCIAVALSRSPMAVAYTAYDLARYSQGRFVLGLGSQVKPHIERRYSMPWSSPAARMREYVQALHAIWSCWQDGTPLKFSGEMYQHDLMTPFFTPESHEWGQPLVYLAGVGERMTEVAGEVADGYFFHAFTTPRYVQEVTLAALRRGRKAGGREDAIAITGPALVATGRDAATVEAAIVGVRKRIAFYASTPAYRGVLDLHGFGDLQPELSALAREHAWDAMGERIPDELLHEMAVVGTPDDVVPALQARWGDVATSITLYTPYASDPTLWPEIAHALRGAS